MGWNWFCNEAYILQHIDGTITVSESAPVYNMENDDWKDTIDKNNKNKTKMKNKP